MNKIICFIIFYFLFLFSCSNIKKQESCICNYPKQITQLHIEQLYEKALVDFYLSNCHIIYYKKVTEGHITHVDSTITIQLSKCSLSLDTVEKHSDSLIFYFSFYNGITRIVKYDWVSSFSHTLALEYTLSDEKLVKEIGVGYESSGNNYDTKFRENLLNVIKINYLKTNIDSIDSSIRCLITKQYPFITKAK